MEKKTNIFQIVLLIIFAFIILVSIIVFATGGKKGGAASSSTGPVVVWAPFQSQAFSQALSGLSATLQAGGVSTQYIGKNSATYETDLVNAFASGVGPDVFVVTPDMLLKHKDKIIEIPFASFPLRTYQGAYVDGAQVFVTDTGILAFPFALDPLMLYYNRDILNNAGFVNPPRTWSEITQAVPNLVSLDESRQISKAAIAFGQFANIDNASEIFQTLMLQLGNPIIAQEKGLYSSVFSSRSSISNAPAQTVIGFYTQFSNPAGDLYSWNTILPRSRDMFVQGRLAFYIGFASELKEIQRQNINLNFDIATLPQRESAERNITFANMYGLALSKQTKNVNGAFLVASSIANGPQIASLVRGLGVSPVKRDILSIKNASDLYSDIINSSALISYSWLNPDKKIMYQYFKDTIDAVIRGETTPGGVISDTDLKIQSLLGSI